MLTLDKLSSFLKEKQMQNSVICLHSSFKSFGEVENGPQTIIDGFLENQCTLVCPAFFYQSGCYPPRENYRSNGIDYSKRDDMPSVNYKAYQEQIEPSMGAIPKAILRYKDALRSNHPSNSFVLIGNQAKSLLEQQSPLNVYSAYKNIYNSKTEAFIVLAGVSFTSCTPIHFAEEISGRRLFRRWAVSHGKIVETEEGSCSDGFENIRDYVKDIEDVGHIGNSEVRIYKFNEFIDVVSKIIANNPQITHCDNQGCLRCNDMERGGPVI